MRTGNSAGSSSCVIDLKTGFSNYCEVVPAGSFTSRQTFEFSQEKTPDPFSTRLIIDLLCTVGEKQDRILFSFRYKFIEAFLLQLVK